MNLNAPNSRWQLSKRRRGVGALGLVFVLGFFSLSQTATGLDIRFIPDWANSTAGELHLWLGYILLLVPGGVMIGYALAPLSRPPLDALVALLHRLSLLQTLGGFAGFALIYMALASAINRLVFLGYPFTDDEWAIRFGGQVLATGRFMAPMPDAIRALPKPFLYARDGYYTSFDWPGSVLTWAVAELTGLNSFVYALVAGLTAVVAAVVVYKLLGRTWAALTITWIVLSPMLLITSGTTHPQSVSRLFVGATVLGYVLALQHPRRWNFALTGAAFGTALCFRPIESCALLAPLLLDLTWRSMRTREGRIGLGLMAGGFAVPLALFAVYNLNVTGQWFVPPRYGLNEMPDRPPPHTKGVLAALQSSSVFWDRFSSNFTYNLLMLMIWFLGPIGALCFGAGCLVNRTTKLLSIGVGTALALTMLHDDLGLHMVGPIHYSETALLVLVVAIHGLRRFVLAANRWHIAPYELLMPIMVSVMIACGTLTLWQCRALRRQANIHATIYRMFDHASFDNSVVIGPPYYAMWQRFPYARRIGTFVFHWRHPSPTRDERVIFAHDVPGTLDALRRDFPNRKFLRFEDETKRFIYTPIDP
jgi:hypothetical protein